MASAGLAKSNIKLLGTTKKIDSPLAKYNSAGQLTCVVCNTAVKSEMVWTAHINGRQHRENVAFLKQSKMETQFTKPQNIPAVKRKADSIISSSSQPSASPSKKGVPADFFDKQPSLNTPVSAPVPIKSILKNSTKTSFVPTSEVVTVLAPTDEMETDDAVMIPPTNEPNQVSSNPIPEGFFDDPKMDAKV